MSKKSKAPKTITQGRFNSMVKMLQETAELERERKALEAKIDANREAWLQFTDEAGLVSDDDRVVAPGVMIKTNTSVSYDTYTAYEWALKDENFTLAGQLLKVRPEAMPTVIALALNDPKYRTWFELNTQGFERAAREQSLVGMPVTGVTTKQVVAITANALKINPDDLRGLYTIIPDEAEAAQEIVPEPRDWDAIDPVAF